MQFPGSASTQAKALTYQVPATQYPDGRSAVGERKNEDRGDDGRSNDPSIDYVDYGPMAEDRYQYQPSERQALSQIFT